MPEPKRSYMLASFLKKWWITRIKGILTVIPAKINKNLLFRRQNAENRCYLCPTMGNCLSLVFIAILFSCNNEKPDYSGTDSTVTELITDSTTASSRPNEPTEDLLQQKINAGIEFYGIGQEPGWSLNMDMENMFSFKSYDGVEMNTPPVAGVHEGGVTLYRMQVEMGEMIITLVEMECTDVMSGQKFPYQVRVSIKRGVDSVFREYEGCGKMLK